MVDVIFKTVLIIMMASVAAFTFAMTFVVLREEKKDGHKRNN